jgi:hypothetical protein
VYFRFASVALESWLLLVDPLLLQINEVAKLCLRKENPLRRVTNSRCHHCPIKINDVIQLKTKGVFFPSVGLHICIKAARRPRHVDFDIHDVKEWERRRLGIFVLRANGAMAAERHHVKQCLDSTKRFRLAHFVHMSVSVSAASARPVALDNVGSIWSWPRHASASPGPRASFCEVGTCNGTLCAASCRRGYCR